MKNLLIVTGIFESVTGILLLISPSLPVSILFDSSVDNPVGLLIGRLAGAALLSLGVACWLVRNDEKSRAVTGIVIAMLLYNVAALALLTYARLIVHLSGIGLWPAVFVHVVLTIWCIKNTLGRRQKNKISF
jgi:hypothetical protein